MSRLVPSASISARRFACAEADTPTTATIAPIPIAIPSADRAARSRRLRRPCSAVPSSSAAAGAQRSMVRGVRLDAHEHSSATIRPSRIVQPPGKRGGDPFLVGDQHERGAVAGELVEQLDDLAP